MILRVTGRPCLVIGGGKVGTRKARQLHEAGALVTLLSSSLYESLEGIHWEKAHYTKDYLLAMRPFLVVAATSSDQANAQIGTDAENAGILCMRADDAGAGDVTALMAREYAGITLALASGSPLLTRHLLNQWETQITPEVIQFAGWLRTLRTHAKTHIPTQAERAALWKQIFAAGILQALQNGELSATAAKERIKEIVGEGLANTL